MAERHRKRLIYQYSGAGDVLPNEWARMITGGPLYYIKSISQGYAVAWDSRRPGHNDIIPVNLLVRV